MGKMTGKHAQYAEELVGELEYVELWGGSSPRSSSRRWPHPLGHGEQATEVGEPAEEPEE